MKKENNKKGQSLIKIETKFKNNLGSSNFLILKKS